MGVAVPQAPEWSLSAAKYCQRSGSTFSRSEHNTQVDENWRKETKQKISYLDTEPWTTLVENVDMVSVADRIDGLQWLDGR